MSVQLWKNLEKDVKSRHSHAIIGKFALVIICFVNTIPLMIVTVLANLGTVSLSFLTANAK